MSLMSFYSPLFSSGSGLQNRSNKYFGSKSKLGLGLKKNSILSLFDDDKFWSTHFNDVSLPLNWSPNADYSMDQDSVTIKFELPGMKKEDINIDINNATLTISGEKKETKYTTDPIITPQLEEKKDEHPHEDAIQDDSSTNNKGKSKISIDIQESKPNKKRVISKSEITYGSFKRVFQLPKDIDVESATAKQENGILTFTIKRILPEQPKSTKIQVN